MTNQEFERKCIICNGISYDLKRVDGYNICKCSSCDLEFLLPMPSGSELSLFYEKYHDIRASSEITRMNGKKNLKYIYSLSDKSSPNLRILDYGCGSNKFVEVCRGEGVISSYGYDKYKEKVEANYINEAQMTEKKWDVITLWGVLEHLVDPLKTLRFLSGMLVEGGLLVLTTIYIQGKIPFRYKPPEHTLYFSKKSLSELSSLASFSSFNMGEYYMYQKSDVYFSILLRTMPEKYKKLCAHRMPEYVQIPTNEVIVVLKK